MEDIGIGENALAGLCRTLYQIVIVGIYTGNHVLADLTFQQSHQDRLLSALQCFVRREHHLEVACLILKLPKHRSPEEHIIITLDESYYLSPGILRTQPVGCF